MRRGFEGGADMPMATAAPLAPYAPPAYSMPAMGGFTGSANPGMALPQLPGKANVPTLMGLLNALKRRWVLAAFLGLLVGLAAAAALWIAAPQGKHQVKAILEIQPQKASPLSPDSGGVDASAHWQFKQTQKKLITMRSLLASVVGKNRVERLSMVASADDKIKLIEDSLITRFEGDTDLMYVMMNGDKPEELKVILEVLIENYVNESNEYLRQKSAATKEALVKTRDDYKKQVDFHRAKIAAFISSGGREHTPETINALVQHLTSQLSQYRGTEQEASKKTTDLEAKLRLWKADLELLATKKFTTNEIEAALLKERDPSVKEIQDQIESIQTKREALVKQAVNLDNPVIAKQLERYDTQIASLRDKRTSIAETRRAEIETKLRAERGESLEMQIRVAEAERVGALATKESYKALSSEIESQINMLTTDAMKLAKEYNENILPTTQNIQLLNQRINETDLWLRAESRIKIREQPVVSMNHNQRQKMLWSTMLGVASFAGVVMLVGYLEWRTRRVDGVDQVVNELGLRIIGTIPAFPTRASIKAGEADANQNWRFILNESVNSTRTMLLHAAKTQQMQVIMVTSAIQGEGKTSLSSQLATSMATAGLRTLIVDCDLRNPSMHRLFDIPLAPGCSEVLLGELDVSDGIQSTSVPNLWVLSAGQCSNRVIAALAQGHPIESLFNRLRGQFDFIVVDTCPILPVADALLIGQHVDGVLLSILQDIQPIAESDERARATAAVEHPPVGCGGQRHQDGHSCLRVQLREAVAGLNLIVRLVEL